MSLMPDHPTPALTFDEWVRFVFDRPTVPFDEWYWKTDEQGHCLDLCLPEPQVIVEYLRRLFNDPSFLAQRFSSDQIAQAVWFIFGVGSEYLGVLRDDSIETASRVALARSIGTLYGSLFATLCGSQMCSLNEPCASRLDTAVYMIWDMDILWFFPELPERKPIDEAQLNVLEQILSIDNVVCRESALHGLGEAQSEYPDRCRDIVDRFPSRYPDIRRELREYALDAREGNVQ